MNRLLHHVLFLAAALAAFCAGAPRMLAADGGASPATPQDHAQAAVNTQAAAAVAMGHEPRIPDFIEEIADELLQLFDIQNTGNSWQRYALATGVLVVFYLLRRLMLPRVFRALRKAAGRMLYRYAEKVFAAVETPVALFIMLCGVYVAIRTLKYPPSVADMVARSSQLLFAGAFLWVIMRIIGASIDYLQDRAQETKSSIAVSIPWIRKTVMTVVFVVGALVIAQSFGHNVQAFLAGLGIGGLAFALAAQDTLANIFGAAVVAIDQPFRLGDTVQLAGHTGVVEDIGMRSMKLRRSDKALVVIPNKTVASESIINLSKFTNRRVEQVLGFTYDSTPAQMEAIVDELRTLIAAQPDVLPGSVAVFFKDFNTSSLDVSVVYLTKDPDMTKHQELKQRLNLEFMRLAVARGLSFAFPTQTLDLGPSAAKALGKS